MKGKRCAFCRRGRLSGPFRVFQHYLATPDATTLVLQCWTHDNARAGQKGCDQLLTEAITRNYVQNGGNMTDAVGPYLGFDTRSREGVREVVDGKIAQA